ncbi:glutaredoxin-C10-like [Andrographis paniculata]|uniref:glutaredoxin-C10-like n=1 Tax=Andrographis paniculata TaxID=175694 RepID=UPI0021E775E6|nr:glutaredoxin-C10-like [Andrographis paniculata]
MMQGPSLSLSLSLSRSWEMATMAAAAESVERLLAENPVVIFSSSSSSCSCMCHVMKHLLSTLGVHHPAVIQLDIAPPPGASAASPALYIGGAFVGGLDTLVALHLSNNLVPKLVRVGALPTSPLN